MSPCKICGSNNWSYKFEKNEKFPNGEVEATCNKCNYYVKFLSRKKEKEEMVEGQPCRKCGNKIILKELKFKEKKLKKTYYFNYCYYCPECKTTYYAEKFKIFNKPQSEESPFAKYKIENGKRYLRNNDWPNRFREVGLFVGIKKNKKFIKVVPIEESNFK